MKKVISVILALLVCASFAFPCFAAEEQKSYLLLGDSIAAGLGLLNPDKASYGAIVAHSNGYKYQNDAVSGHTSKQLISRLNKKSVQNDVKNADIISISIGGNDYLMNNMVKLIAEAKNGNYSSFEKIADNYYENLGTIIDTVRSLNPNAAILLQNLYNPRSDSLREIYQNGINILNLRINRYAAENAERGIYLVDLASYMAGLDSTYFQNDQTHPSAKGHLVISEKVIDVLYENGLGTATAPVIEEDGENKTGFLTYLKKLINSIKELFEKIKSAFNR